MDASPLTALATTKYAAIRSQHPREGRRAVLLRLADEFWALSSEQKTALVLISQNTSGHDAPVPPFATDPDPFDEVTARQEPGVLVRTDFTNEEAWSSFCERLQQAENELASEAQMVVEDEEDRTHETEGADDAMDEDDEESSESDSGSQNEAGPSTTGAPADAAPLIYILNPDSPEARTALAGLSNLGALRLLTDVVLRPAPARPVDAKALPPHRLRSRDGWQETYVGKTLWIYDARSNTDGCARLVSGKADLWGTATGDSWRARVSHMCELQAGLTSGGMTIDFGGLDRWDYAERMRNLGEAETQQKASN